MWLSRLLCTRHLLLPGWLLLGSSPTPRVSLVGLSAGTHSSEMIALSSPEAILTSSRAKTT